MIRVVFLRHGKKEPLAGRPEHDVPLLTGEAIALETVGNRLREHGLLPDLWLASHWDHCWQSARATGGAPAIVYRVCGLTPHSAEQGFSLNAILTEAARLGAPVETVERLGIAGHEDRLSKLVNSAILDSQEKIFPLERREVVIVQAASLAALVRGMGRIEHRWR
jgi:phosphohistidine phosphatase SixA